MDKAPQSSDPWYVAAFRQEYLEVYATRNAADAQRAVDCAHTALGLKAGDRVLDLCCGAGRHAGPLLALGVDLVGLDLSADLLKQARRDHPTLRLIQADARQVPLGDGQFDVVLSFFTSFGYFREEAENLRHLRQISRVLVPDGRVLIDHINPAFVEATLVPASEDQRGGATIRSTRRIDKSTQRVEKDVVIEREGRVISQYTESVRLYRNEEWREMLENVGLNLQRTLGDFDGRPFDATQSPRQILVAEVAK